MRLINANTFDLEDFTLKDKPGYAILSHTWGEDEVTFQDMATPERSLRKGWSKIVNTCKLALDSGLQYAWIDTCCIDKSSSAELSEAINSMFAWYQDAAICYAFLSDFNGVDHKELLSCRWWTRGWTLQELLAPSELLFYDKSWRRRGSRESWALEISQQTGIPKGLLFGSHAPRLHDLSVASKMSWAAQRNTTRLEDEAYCLLGIFDVSMPLIYGEGRKAFHRLQEEIMKRSNDSTIFAHTSNNLIAESSSQFAQCGDLKRHSDSFEYEYAITNKGLKVTNAVHLDWWTGGQTDLLFLSLPVGATGVENLPASVVGLCLQQLGPQLFMKHPKLKVDRRQSRVFGRSLRLGEKPVFIRSLRFTEICIILQYDVKLMRQYLSTERRTVQVFLPSSISLLNAVPRNDFNFENSFFISNGSGEEFYDSHLQAIELRYQEHSNSFFLLFNSDFAERVYMGVVNSFICDRDSHLYRSLFDSRNAVVALGWYEFKTVAGDHTRMSDTITLNPSTNMPHPVRIQARLQRVWQESQFLYQVLTFQVSELQTN